MTSYRESFIFYVAYS